MSSWPSRCSSAETRRVISGSITSRSGSSAGSAAAACGSAAGSGSTRRRPDRLRRGPRPAPARRRASARRVPARQQPAHRGEAEQKNRPGSSSKASQSTPRRRRSAYPGLIVDRRRSFAAQSGTAWRQAPARPGRAARRATATALHPSPAAAAAAALIAARRTNVRSPWTSCGEQAAGARRMDQHQRPVAAPPRASGGSRRTASAA